jgi:hypothetical protein
MEKKNTGPDCDLKLFVERSEKGLFLHTEPSDEYTEKQSVRLPDVWFPTCKMGEVARVGVYDMETECCFLKDKVEVRFKNRHEPIPYALPKIVTGKNTDIVGEKYTCVLCNSALEFEVYRDANKNEMCLCIVKEEDYLGINIVKFVDFTQSRNTDLLNKFRTDILRRIESRCGL